MLNVARGACLASMCGPRDVSCTTGCKRTFPACCSSSPCSPVVPCRPGTPARAPWAPSASLPTASEQPGVNHLVWGHRPAALQRTCSRPLLGATPHNTPFMRRLTPCHRSLATLSSPVPLCIGRSVCLRACLLPGAPQILHLLARVLSGVTSCMISCCKTSRNRRQQGYEGRHLARAKCPSASQAARDLKAEVWLHCTASRALN